MNILTKVQKWADDKAPVIKGVVALAAIGLAIGAAISGQWVTASTSATVAVHALTSSAKEANEQKTK